MVRFAPLSVALLAATASAADRALQTETLKDIIVADGNLTTLALALERGLFTPTITIIDVLSDATGDPLTLFTPNNDAFAMLDQDFLGLLLTPPWSAHLSALLFGHGVFGSVLSTDLMDGMEVETYYETLTVSIVGESVSLSNAVTNSSVVIEANLLASNGVIHKVDGVLLPSFWNRGFLNVGDTNQDFSTLTELLVLSELGSQFQPGTYATIFAPTDDAFAALGEETLAFYKNPDNKEELVTLLTNHVLGGVFPSLLIEDGATLPALLGFNLTFTKDVDETVYVNDAKIIDSDFLLNSGIVHAIDKVLTKNTEIIAPVAPPAIAPIGPIAPPMKNTQAPAPTPVKAPVAAPTGSSSDPTSAASSSSWFAASCSAVFVAVVAMA